MAWHTLQLASNYPEWRDKIAETLKEAAHDAYALFANRDRVEGRAASDYAYDALWRLTELEASSASLDNCPYDVLPARSMTSLIRR
jgi:hypothetical protein